jgi:hypothetical protein
MKPLERSRPDTCLSDRMLDMWVAGELAGDGRDAAEGHLATCEACSARLREIERGKDEFAREAPPFAAIAEPRERRRNVWPIAGALALAAAVALVVRAPSDDFGSRTKGGDRLGFYVMHDGAVRAGANGEVVRPGDRLQLVSTNAKPRFFAVLSRDGGGHASIYFPKEPTATRLEPGVERPLPYALELDTTLGAETIYGLFCDRAGPLEPLRARLEQAGDATEWPDGCRVDRLKIEKRP